MKRKRGRVTETIKRRRVDTIGEEKEILLRGNVCAYLTCRLMGDLDTLDHTESECRLFPSETKMALDKLT